MTIFFRPDKNRKETLRDKIEKRLEGHPSWQLRVGDRILCPFCGKAAASIRGEDPPAAMVEHMRECAAYAGGNRKELSPETLEVLRVRELVKQELPQNPALWANADPDGKWLCPYCAEFTKVKFPSSKTITGETLTAIAEHLQGCLKFRERSRPLDLQIVQKQLADRTQAQKLTEKVRKQIQSDPSLTYTDSRGRWVCPWCLQPYATVDVSSDFAKRNAAPAAVAEHLLHHCAAFRAKKPKAALADLEKVFAPVQAGKDTSETAVLEAIRLEELQQDIETMRVAIAEQQAATTTAKEINQSLELARKRQIKMLPSVPQVAGLDIDVWYSPCASVSGDLYDFTRIDEHRIGVLLGDVSGHGIEAALIMSMAKKALQLHGRGEPDPVRTLQLANEDLFHDLEKDTFVTVFYIVFDMETRTARCCRAGHNPTYRLNPARDPVLHEIKPPGIGIGMNPGPIFAKVIKEEKVILQKGDTFVIYTDGITEAMNPKNEEYGAARFQGILTRFADHEPKYLIHLLRGDVEVFTAGRPAEDDMTVICVQVTA